MEERGEGPDDARTVLVVEPGEVEPSVASGLLTTIFDVLVADNRRDALRYLEHMEPDAVIVDFELPGLSSVDLCRDVRQTSDVPIIVVGRRAGDDDVVLCLEMGADDFVTTPYSQRELVARVRALIRRQERALVPAIHQRTSGKLRVGDIRLDRVRHEAFLGGAQLSLAPKEFTLLAILLEQAGAVVSRQDLMDLVWGSDYVGDAKTLDTHIKRLRSKIESDPKGPPRIVTVRGIGFRLERSVDDPDEGQRHRPALIR